MKYMHRVGLNRTPTFRSTGWGWESSRWWRSPRRWPHAKLLILDEPTSALNEKDSEHLLRSRSCRTKQHLLDLIYKLNEVAAVADSITILRDGKTIETLKVGRTRGKASISEERIIKGWWDEKSPRCTLSATIHRRRPLEIRIGRCTTPTTPSARSSTR